ncbi:MAG: phosphoribosylglycinamide formyltransferase [Rhodospirillaceae bacterium TMED23]|nr:MAG: phosphoribosylglycinamide formyltransferase [Rhodospirillaceae bacterium TMED23]
MKLKVGVLISGNGSNLQSIIDACEDPNFPAELSIVISNKAEAYGLGRAKKANIKTKVIEHQNFQHRSDFEKNITKALINANVELVCLAGFMRILTDTFVYSWKDRLINVHPSLLPIFKGLNTHQRAIECGVKFSGCTIHFVSSSMDEGPIILQAAVPVHQNDTSKSLAERVLDAEHKLYPMAIRLFANKKIWIENDLVKFTNIEDHNEILINPNIKN